MTKHYVIPRNPCEEAFDLYTPEERARALYYFFGWQGGTIHQLAKETGLKVEDILERRHGAEKCDPGQSGFSAVRTCDRDWRVGRLAPLHRGEWIFWRDAIRGFWVTGPLDGLNDRYETNHAH